MAKDVLAPTVGIGKIAGIQQRGLGLRFLREDLPPDLKTPIGKCCEFVNRIVAAGVEDPFSVFDRAYAAEHGCQP